MGESVEDVTESNCVVLTDWPAVFDRSIRVRTRTVKEVGCLNAHSAKRSSICLSRKHVPVFFHSSDVMPFKKYSVSTEMNELINMLQ